MDDKELNKMLFDLLKSIRREMEYLEETRVHSEGEELELFDLEAIPIPESVYKEICVALKSKRIHFMAIS